MKVLVTGGGGFLGSHLIEEMVKLPKVEKIVNIDPKQEGFNKNNLFIDDRILNICSKGFILNKLEWKKIIEDTRDFDILYSIGALTHVDSSIENPSEFIYWNNEVFINMLEAIRHISPKLKIVHISTDEVFGSINNNSDSVPENSKYYNPSSIYSSSKVQQEQIIDIYKKAYNLNISIVRSTNLFGTRQDIKKFIPKVVNCLKNETIIPLYGYGDQKRTWLYVKDAVEFLLLFLTNDFFTSRNKIFHISNQYNEITNFDLIGVLGQLLNKKSIIEFVPDRLNHDYRYSLDYSDTTFLTDWLPNTSLAEGLKKII